MGNLNNWVEGRGEVVAAGVAGGDGVELAGERPVVRTMRFFRGILMGQRAVDEGFELSLDQETDESLD